MVIVIMIIEYYKTIYELVDIFVKKTPHGFNSKFYNKVTKSTLTVIWTFHDYIGNEKNN